MISSENALDPGCEKAPKILALIWCTGGEGVEDRQPH